jgi:hypothetical protein
MLPRFLPKVSTAGGRTGVGNEVSAAGVVGNPKLDANGLGVVGNLLPVPTVNPGLSAVTPTAPLFLNPG